MRTLVAILDAIDVVFLGVLLLVALVAALVAPPLVAKEYFGAWLDAGTIVVSLGWISLVGLFARALWRKDAGLDDAFLFALTTILYLVVVGGLISKAGSAV